MTTAVIAQGHQMTVAYTAYSLNSAFGQFMFLGTLVRYWEPARMLHGT
jgi:hypothetical protein